MTRFHREALLARMFFGRFFESDLMPPGIAQTRLVFSGFAVLTAPMYLLTFMCLLKYERIAAFAPERLPTTMLLDELVFVTVSMIGLGALALMTWDGVFPDRRDARTIGLLPLSTRTIVSGRLAALGGVAALFAIGPNLLTGALYGPMLWIHGGAAGPIRGAAAHLIATGSAGLFVYFLVIAVQGVLLSLLGRRLAQRLALLLQTLFVVLLLQTLLFLPFLRGLVADAFGTRPTVTAAVVPPAWFLSLYDLLAGTDLVVPVRYAVVALGVTGAAIVAATLVIVGSYRRLTRQALETLDAGPARWWRRGSIEGATLVMARRSPSRAVAAFTLHTLRRSRAHLMLLATYGGLAAAIAVSTMIPLLATRGPAAALAAPGVTVLSISLVFNFFLILGARVILGIPTEIRANWLFRLHLAESDATRAIAGARVALLVGVVSTIALATAAGGTILWGFTAGVVHGTFTFLAGWLLVELLLSTFRSVPFTCIYTPGHWRVKGLWPLYATAFTIYAFWFAALALLVQARPALLVPCAGVVAATAIVLEIRRRHAQRVAPGLTFAGEEVDEMFAGFGLSEAVAAAPPESPGSRPRRG